ncbi:hypothetical protein FOZ63_003626, partial [Perkinsus olseni]
AYWRSPRKQSPRSRSARVASPLDLDFGREWLLRRDAEISRKMIDAERRAMAECVGGGHSTDQDDRELGRDPSTFKASKPQTQLVSFKVFSPVDRPGLRRSENILEKAGLQYVGPQCFREPIPDIPATLPAILLACSRFYQIRGWKEQADKYARKRRDDGAHDCGFSPAIIRFGDDIAGDASDASQRFVQDTNTWVSRTVCIPSTGPATVLGEIVVHGIYVVRKVYEEDLLVPDGKAVESWR